MGWKLTAGNRGGDHRGELENLEHSVSLVHEGEGATRAGHGLHPLVTACQKGFTHGNYGLGF